MQRTMSLFLILFFLKDSSKSEWQTNLMLCFVIAPKCQLDKERGQSRRSLNINYVPYPSDIQILDSDKLWLLSHHSSQSQQQVFTIVRFLFILPRLTTNSGKKAIKTFTGTPVSQTREHAPREQRLCPCHSNPGFNLLVECEGHW